MFVAVAPPWGSCGGCACACWCVAALLAFLLWSCRSHVVVLARPFLWAHSSFLSLVGWLARFFSVPPWPWLVCPGVHVGGAPCSGCCGLVPCLSSALCCPLAFGPWALGLVFFFGAGPCLFLGAGLCCPVCGAPFLRWLCFLLSAPFCRLAFPLMCRCCPPGAHGLCGGCASACSCWGCSCLCGSPVRALVLALGCLGALVARGVCCLVAVLLPGACLACLAFPLGAGPCLWLFSALVLRLG